MFHFPDAERFLQASLTPNQLTDHAKPESRKLQANHSNCVQSKGNSTFQTHTPTLSSNTSHTITNTFFQTQQTSARTNERTHSLTHSQPIQRNNREHIQQQKPKLMPLKLHGPRTRRVCNTPPPKAGSWCASPHRPTSPANRGATRRNEKKRTIPQNSLATQSANSTQLPKTPTERYCRSQLPDTTNPNRTPPNARANPAQ